MDALRIIVLAVLQGLTEFLPISSSAHLILVPEVAGWADQGLAFDVSVHVGTLVAVVAYFRDDFTAMIRAVADALRGRGMNPDSRLAWHLAAATVPVALAGLAVDLLAGDALRSPRVIASATIVFAVVLWIADRFGRRVRGDGEIRLRDAILIGLAQTLALVPGTSRSGITLTAALALGLTREAAARFSILLGAPVIALAGGLKTVELVLDAAPAEWGAMAAGATLSGAFAYLSIHWFLRLVERIGTMPFVVYRLALGAVLFAFVV